MKCGARELYDMMKIMIWTDKISNGKSETMFSQTKGHKGSVTRMLLKEMIGNGRGPIGQGRTSNE